MDVLELLELDHKEAKQVFKKLEAAKGASATRLWEQLSGMLSLHEELEETFFYPRLKEDKAARDLVLEGYQEHHVMDVLIEERKIWNADRRDEVAREMKAMQDRRHKEQKAA